MLICVKRYVPSVKYQRRTEQEKIIYWHMYVARAKEGYYKTVIDPITHVIKIHVSIPDSFYVYT